MARFELALWHPSMPLQKISDGVSMAPRVGWSVGELDKTTNRPHDRTYGRFPLLESWKNPNFDITQLLGFIDILKDDEFINEGRAILYVNNEIDDVEVLIGRTSMSVLSRLGVEISIR